MKYKLIDYESPIDQEFNFVFWGVVQIFTLYKKFTRQVSSVSKQGPKAQYPREVIHAEITEMILLVLIKILTYILDMF
jgi:hypothetical protein